MRRIGVISDTHGYREVIDIILEKTKDKHIDMWLHAGDLGDDARYMATKTNVPVIAVRGNNDRQRPLEPEEQLIPFEDTYIYMVHGHKIPYYNRIQELLYIGEAMGATLVVSGHTHYHASYEGQNCLYVNPGSPILPRDKSGGTFAIVTYQEGKFSVKFYYMNDL
ncbi:metallophosphoesterase family protein [Veillonella montpellierensis]|uniref:metallophosphoesterase family protein n=1 Tax=Veillonella montpellierensis TaxID=187328 RepID=UPI0004276C66|nr:YfcE family phosphodiesterase [Veillonella montpellierensis]